MHQNYEMLFKLRLFPEAVYVNEDVLKYAIPNQKELQTYRRYKAGFVL